MVVLAIPALVVWIRARKLTDGSRGLTTSTLIIVCGAFVLGATLTPSSEPSAPTAEAVPAAPVEQAAVLPAPQPLVVAPLRPGPCRPPQPLVRANLPLLSRTSGNAEPRWLPHHGWLRRLCRKHQPANRAAPSITRTAQRRVRPARPLFRRTSPDTAPHSTMMATVRRGTRKSVSRITTAALRGMQLPTPMIDVRIIDRAG